MVENIIYKGIDLECKFQIDPYLPAVLYGDNAHPEEGGDIYDLEIFIESTEISDLLSEDQIYEIKDLIYEQL
ncbi:hypothetical protein UFOVP597_39 [uncultured Caudovirales phage]|uniref:Uncharacterized protein n=1 Tax=uncultured Caudovirales phage TaxID=2100421 RepID=A0A6J5N3M5_9CAUD|nr:hypothetical protein UFOVP597_39 [uncultured Caudovirales phage]